MYAGKVVSYKTIIDKVSRDFGFENEIQEENSIEWLAEFMAHTNSGVVMDNKIAYISICDGRGDLPHDLHKIEQTARLTCVETVDDILCGKGVKIPMRWSTDNFHKQYHKDDRDYTCYSADTYTVGQGYIFTSFNEGFVAMAYDAIPTDEEGYPTIPAEQQWMEAAAHYIAHRIARKLFMKDSISEKKYMIIERDKEWYFAQAVNHSKQWNGVDEAEFVKNSHVRTVPDLQAHNTFFANMQIPEQRNFRGKNLNTTTVTVINTL